MSTIPADLFVEVTPSVLNAGGNAVSVIGLVLTESTRVPIGAVYSFSDDGAVASFFGSGSAQATFAAVYFDGYEGATAQPGALLYAQYPATAVAAYLGGGPIGSQITLAQLQALSGSLTVVMDGYSHIISSINFSGDSSFSAAAAAIQAAFTDPTEATFTASLGATFTGSQSGTNLTTTSVTGLISVGDVIAGTGVASGTTILSQTSGTTGGAGVYVTSLSGTASSASCTGTSTVLDVTVLASGTVAVGQTLSGASITGSPVITAQIGGTAGGVGTYRISGGGFEIASESMTGVATAPLVTYDSVSQAFIVTSGITGAPSTAAFATGTLAASLDLTSATGAVLSQGAAATTPSAFMTSLVAVTTNWACFATDFDPDGGSGNAQKQAFAAWNTLQDDSYAYIAWDHDVTPTQSVPATGSLGYILQQNGNSGTFPVFETVGEHMAAFVMGAAASINFNATNGRTSFAFMSQPGLVAGVTTGTAAVNLGGSPQVPGSFGNGYNYYGAIGAANEGFLNLQRGTVTGPFQWFDSYINQIWLNSLLQATLLAFLANKSVGSIPFTAAGANLIENALSSPIQQGLTFGAYGPNPGGLSSSQIAAVNNQAGANIAGVLQTQGYYLQINPAPANVRASRGPWAITLWYLDNGACQSLSLSSIAVQG